MFKETTYEGCMWASLLWMNGGRESIATCVQGTWANLLRLKGGKEINVSKPANLPIGLFQIPEVCVSTFVGMLVNMLYLPVYCAACTFCKCIMHFRTRARTHTQFMLQDTQISIGMLNKTITIPSPLKHYLQELQANPPPLPPLIPLTSQEDLERQSDRQADRQKERESESKAYVDIQQDKEVEKNEVGKREEKDADPSLFRGQEAAETPGTQFTCFTNTKVQTLTQKLATRASSERPGNQFTCFTSKKVKILTQKLSISGSESCK